MQVVPVGEWIGPIVVPLMDLLRWVHGHVGNYGWSIVLLTVLINLVMAPLRHYGIANGIKMAKLAPEMRAIQDRYRRCSRWWIRAARTCRRRSWRSTSATA